MNFIFSFLLLAIDSFIASNVFAATVDAQLQQLGFSGITIWTYALIGIAGGIAISFAVTDKVKQGAAFVSNEPSPKSESPPLNNSKSSNNPRNKSGFVSWSYRSPVVYQAHYSVPAQVYTGISLQFDWLTLDWYFASRGYYRQAKKPRVLYRGFTLSNPKFSARVFDFKTGMWRYEAANTEYTQAKIYQLPNFSSTQVLNNLEEVQDGYVDPSTGEFFAHEDVNMSSKRKDFYLDDTKRKDFLDAA